MLLDAAAAAAADISVMVIFACECGHQLWSS